MHPSVDRPRSTIPAVLLCLLLGAPLLASAAEADMAAIERAVAAQHDASRSSSGLCGHDCEARQTWRHPTPSGPPSPSRGTALGATG